VRRRPQLTVRARLTLLYIALFAACGAIVVAVSYVLVAQLGAPGLGQRPSSRGGIPAAIAAQCRSEQLAPSDKNVIAQCIFQLLGAQHQRDLTLSHLLEYSLITLAVVIALAAILGWIFSGRALRPVHRITAAARAASEENLSARVALTGPRDELRELAETFDEMLARLQAAFESQQRFIANASHELRTPLAVMRATVDVVLGNPDSTPGDLRAMAADIRAAVDHAEHLIGAFAHPCAQPARAHRPRGGRPGHGHRGRPGHRRCRRPPDSRHAGARRHSGRSGARRTPHREPGRQRGPLQHRRR